MNQPSDLAAVSGDYKYGFTTEIETYALPKGLNDFFNVSIDHRNYFYFLISIKGLSKMADDEGTPLAKF